MADQGSDDGGWSLNSQPAAYVIPLLILIVASFIAAVVLRRRWRGQLVARGGSAQYRDRATSRIGVAPRQRIRRQGAGWPWGATRSQEEGLNELGEAPPPYDGKREGELQHAELRDLETGTGASPPEHLALPAPAVTRDTR